MYKSSRFLLHKIIDALVDDLLHILMKVVGNIEDAEDIVFDEQISTPRQILFTQQLITTKTKL